ncbi:MAG: lipoyl(octanoyl) transferase LipB [Myxococcota bacterium]|jgi:lipoate-protein ligase B|nr:lipoyl(octanoyl) transferase LipB [Myxococcota bacterium]
MSDVASGLQVEWLGRVGYAEGLAIQEGALKDRSRGARGDRLLLLEHPPVVTLGRNTREENLLLSAEEFAARGVEVHSVPRGGDVTFHAPGQLVGYLLVDLEARGQPDLHRFLRGVESALIEALDGLGIGGASVPGRTGVFVAASTEGGQGPVRKIASIGFGVRRWVTFHGFALNVSLELSGFDAIVPCGLRDVEMTSVARELGIGPLGLDIRAREAVGASFRRAFA